ncbi:MAG: hypothetical protein ACLPR9_17000 [Acidimicrobiales bacterium]
MNVWTERSAHRWVGGAAVTASPARTPVVLFAMILVQTPPHLWALAFKCKDDYLPARVPMLSALAVRPWQRADPRAAMQLFGYSTTYLTLLPVLLTVDMFTKH